MVQPSALVQTPKNLNKGVADFEFTPIGQESKHSSSSKGILNIKQRTVKAKRNPLDNSPLANDINGGSSFFADSTFDTIHHSVSKQHKAPTSSSSPIKKISPSYDLLSNGTNPVKQQQENVSKLQEDNYNLKVKIASLTRFLDSITNSNQKEIYKQNSELQERLIKERSEVALLTKEMASVRALNANENESEIVKYKNEIGRLGKVIDRLEQELKEKNYELEKRPSPISKSQIERMHEQLEDLKNETEEKEHEIRRRDEIIEAKEDTIEFLESKVEELQQLQQLQKSQIDQAGAADSQIHELKNLLKSKVDKVQHYEEVLDNKSSELESLKETSAKILKKLADSDQLIKDLKSSLKETTMHNDLLQDKLRSASDSRTYRDNETLLNSKRNQLELESEIQKLQSKIDILNETVHQQKQTIDDFEKNDPAISNEELARLLKKLEISQKKIADVMSERDAIKKRLDVSDMRYIQLKNNSEKTFRAYEKLKNQNDSNKITEYDNYDIKDEIAVLSKQVKELNFQNEALEKQIQKERDQKYATQSLYGKQELKSLMSRCSELEEMIFEKDKLLEKANIKYHKEIQDYKNLVSQNEEQITNLRKNIKSLELQSSEKTEDEKFELLKSKTSKEKEITLLNFQLNELKDVHETEIQYLKKTIDHLKESATGLNKNLHFDRSAELLLKIEEKNKKIKLLTEKLNESMFDLRILEKSVLKLDNTKNDLISENAHLRKKLHSLDQKLSYFVKELKSSGQSSGQNEINILKLELLSKEQEIVSYNKQFKEIKSEILRKYYDTVDHKTTLERKIEKLTSKYRQLQNSLQKNDYREQYMNDKDSFLKYELDYYRLKYTKGIYAIKDLKFINSFMVRSIQANNNHIKGDIKKLQESGIYPDYQLICTKKPSLSVLVKFVVGAIRIKRKTEHSSMRNQKIEELKNKLDPE